MIVVTCVDLRYQVFAPLLAWTAQRLWGCKTVVFSTDAVHARVGEVMASIPGAQFVTDADLGRKIAPSVLRFLLPLSTIDKTSGEDYYLIVDADLLLTDLELPQWCTAQMQKTAMPYAGHLGARWKPERPAITGRQGWTHEWQRVTGGFFMTTPKWYAVTEKARNHFAAASRMPDFREADEVTLARLITSSGLPLPPRGFPKELRGIHLGDFRWGMQHRYQNTAKMRTLIPEATLRHYRNMRGSVEWQTMVKTLLAIPAKDLGTTETQELQGILSRLDEYADTGKVRNPYSGCHRDQMPS